MYACCSAQEHARHEAAQQQLQELTFKPKINSICDVGPIISMQDPGRHLAQVYLHHLYLTTQPRINASMAEAHTTVASASTSS